MDPKGHPGKLALYIIVLQKCGVAKFFPAHPTGKGDGAGDNSSIAWEKVDIRGEK
jgi:hypothetical protein